ncbi:MAG: OmpA family protein [Myxococcales bacterium]|nr:OmpA family protein [Myxococcales bacterium]
MRPPRPPGPFAIPETHMPGFSSRSACRLSTLLASLGASLCGAFLWAAAFEVKSAHAQDLATAPVDLQVFRPAVDSKGFTTLNASQILAPGDFSFGLVMTWARQPLFFEGSGERTFKVQNLVTPTLLGAVGIFSQNQVGLQLGLTLPLGIMSGRATPIDPRDPETANDDEQFKFDGQGLGDLGIHPKLRLSNASRNKVGLAVIPTVIVPTGNKDRFLGEGQLILQPTVAVDTEFGKAGRFRIGINAGARIRTKENAVFVDNPATFSHQVMGMNENTGHGIRLRNELLGGLGMSFAVVPEQFDIVGEVYGQYGLNAKKLEGTDEKTLPPLAEAVAGIKLYMARNSFFEAGAGWGFLKSYGAAERGRIYVGFIFEPSIGDRDRDGYKDDVDQCPDDPEDFDDFEDLDGCPDPDNDQDGILDDDDSCPNDPETRNGYKDEDGCPDDLNSDRDGDGIPDDDDQCPDDPEDKDGFEDEDGCPEPDNDRDGILDVDDLCPNDPEDKDGFEDVDGCPDPDNDHDRILDKDDHCPNEPETYNGTDDDDGCPDKGKVIVRKGKLEILDKIYFETDSDVIKSISFPLIDAIAATMNGNPQIELIEIQGHADERGADDHNLDLTERRAASVKRALEERNVDGLRLSSHGYGETKPICREHNEGCWSQNRRVEFVILKRSDEYRLQGTEGQ